MKLEVIATTLEDALTGEQCGADRLELVTGIKEGGLTPSYALIKQVVAAVSIPVHVMIRPHSRSFVYNEYDETLMLEDIEVAKKLGVSGVVLGMLTPNHTIDIPLLEKCLERCDGLNVTFHRAFDETSDLVAAVEQLKNYPQITHILTSGGKDSALEAMEMIQELVARTTDSQITILAGSGLTIPSIHSFIQATGVQEVHFGSRVRHDNDAIHTIDCQKMATLKKELAK